MSFVRDDQGTDVLDIAEAQMEAADTLADMAKDLSMRCLDCSRHPMAIEVRDPDGPLFSIGFCIFETNAVSVCKITAHIS
jgi:oligoribonuclease NrnB/cAMP/cGMP phosphodiesterase (DHH superfamily)